MGIFKKLFKIFKYDKYDYIVPLGYNCEIAFQFFQKYKFIDSSLFNWTYTNSIKNLIYALNNFDKILSDGIANPTPLYECQQTHILFHGKADFSKLIYNDGTFNLKNIEDDKNELKLRIGYLITKFKKMLNSDCPILFIYKLKYSDCLDEKINDYLFQLYDFFDKKTKKFKFVLVLNNSIKDKISITKPNFIIETVNIYAPDNDVTNIEKGDRDNIFFYYYKLLKTIIKLFLYSISLNKEKIKKYKRKLNYELKYSKHKIIGHQAVLMSLFRGFHKLNINYEYNRITKHTKNIIILWCDHKDLEIIRKLKQKSQTIKIITAPTASGKAGHLFTTFQYEFAKLPYIDCSLVASDWVKKYYKTKIDSKYSDKIKIWPSGVELQVNNDKNREIKPKLSCICYYKYHKTINNNLSSYLSNLGINNYTHKKLTKRNIINAI